jgi:hypothetical protein
MNKVTRYVPKQDVSLPVRIDLKALTQPTAGVASTLSHIWLIAGIAAVINLASALFPCAVKGTVPLTSGLPSRARLFCLSKARFCPSRRTQLEHPAMSVSCHRTAHGQFGSDRESQRRARLSRKVVLANASPVAIFL